jgi:multiple sugar transport system substrate-binding protein
MPVWNASAPSYGNDGGSSTAVLKGCQDVEQAAEFADWMSTSMESVANLVNVAGIYPAATSALTNPALAAPNAFYGKQVIYDVFRNEMPEISSSWQWGPTMTQTSTDMGNDLGNVESGSQSLPATLSDVQRKTVSELESQGVPVSGRWP